MKRIILFISVSVLSVSSIFAQKKTVLTAKNQLKFGEYADAISKINEACDNESTKNSPYAWFTKYQIYSEVAKAKPDMVPDASDIATQALIKTLTIDPNYEKAEVGAMIGPAIQDLYTAGANALNNKQYDKSFASFDQFNKLISLTSKTYFLGNFTIDTFNHNAKLYKAMAAENASKIDEAISTYNDLLKDPITSEADKQNIFIGLINTYKKQNNEEAMLATLEKAQTELPNNNFVLNEQINYYSSKGKMDELGKKLEEATKKDPNNSLLQYNYGVILYNLSNGINGTAPLNAVELASKSKSAFEKAISLDPNNADIQYMMGVMYFNKGAELSQKIGKEKDPAKSKKMLDERTNLFKSSLPYMEKSLQVLKTKSELTNNDLNTLQGVDQALRAIYGMLSDDASFEKLDKLNAFMDSLKK